MAKKKVKKWVIPDSELQNQRGQLNVRMLLGSIGVDLEKPYTLQRDVARGATIVTQEVEDGEDQTGNSGGD